MILLFDPMPGVPFRGLALTWMSATIGLHFVRSTDAITDKSWLSYNSQLPFTRCADWRVVPWFISEQVIVHEICNDETVMVNDTVCNLTQCILTCSQTFHHSITMSSNFEISWFLTICNEVIVVKLKSKEPSEVPIFWLWVIRKFTISVQVWNDLWRFERK